MKKKLKQMGQGEKLLELWLAPANEKMGSGYNS